MSDLDIKEVSYVGGPANRRKYIFVKSNGGDNDMDMKLEDLTKEEREKLEIKVRELITPDLRKSLEGDIAEDIKKKLEESFTKEKEKEISDKLRVDIEQSVREEFGKQDEGVSKEAAAKITTALKDISRGMTALGKLVGYGYKAGSDEAEIEELKKKISELESKILTKEDLAEIVKEINV